MRRCARLLKSLDETILLVPRHEYIIRRDAHLACVDHFTPEDTTSGKFQVVLSINYHGAFASQLSARANVSNKCAIAIRLTSRVTGVMNLAAAAATILPTFAPPV
jgi:hypothetical protein